MQKLFLTFFYVGLMKPAPGTWGSIAGAVIAVLILKYLGAQTLFLASILLFLASINIINKYEETTKEHDQSHIVIDEVAGVWLAISISSASWLAIILSVIFFRILDITKPSIIGRVDKNVKGGLGVMGDDMIAGAFAGLMSAICYWVLLKI
ncbi:TPA: phosphatidylglycerophosphatase A [Campylobacter fetus subsp. venerealis]|uniref:Phosphatidylglycerophosphatase A n=2 Tax=Campylobacter fetus TaxID=196 RepID=A0A5L8W3P9_CAMFE|nr:MULTISPECIES: phosphatidylglycerophosphatase A [Campylobacter]OCS23104.1 phosphatidylglycerophosphatase [Campylobacter fetus subsp. venerealis cfvi97/532]OCS27299.1 phosphatidylglycerophosphatase [Campylobacter fetus subsp. venerealis cfvB10]OCS30404.1 phosphatidylglycerophosphatase [Campylobacter fetus subsp. venerealis LMG 6570 = CCUG 33900]OCS43261.1 phosphatidylglycerophosphatase [Campylobacter fetus subsp. venerealis cfvi02/298]AHE93748.1 phosphatidylglycerophosphatase A [Campylobacter